MVDTKLYKLLLLRRRKIYKCKFYLANEKKYTYKTQTPPFK